MASLKFSLIDAVSNLAIILNTRQTIPINVKATPAASMAINKP